MTEYDAWSVMLENRRILLESLLEWKSEDLVVRLAEIEAELTSPYSICPDDSLRWMRTAIIYVLGLY